MRENRALACSGVLTADMGAPRGGVFFTKRMSCGIPCASKRVSNKGSTGMRRRFGARHERRMAVSSRVSGGKASQQESVESLLQWGANRSGSYRPAGVLGTRANGAVIGKDAETALLVSVCHTNHKGLPVAATKVGEVSQGGENSFKRDRKMNLGVEYRVRSVASGSFPFHATRRELAPSEATQTMARRVDAALRPVLFGDVEGASGQVQVIFTEISTDGTGDAHALAINSGSLALCLAGMKNKSMKFYGPVGCVRVRAERNDNGIIEFEEFPATGGTAVGERAPLAGWTDEESGDVGQTEARKEVLDLLLSGTGPDNIVALDFATSEPLDEEVVCKAIRFAAQKMPNVLQSQHEFLSSIDRSYDGPVTKVESPRWLGLPAGLRDELFTQAKELVSLPSPDNLREARREIARKLRQAIDQGLLESAHDEVTLAYEIVDTVSCDGIRAAQLPGSRPTSRGPNDIRETSVMFDLFPGAHGSASFKQGRAACLATATAAPLSLALRSDQPNKKGGETSIDHSDEPSEEQTLIVAFDLPPRASGVTGHIGKTRRTVALGEFVRRALLPVIPSVQEWPYCNRVFCEALQTDGGTAMSAVTAASLAMRSSGMPMKDLVAGVSIGLFKRSSPPAQEKIILDMDSFEEQLSGMELQVAGTRLGITAMQLDTANGSNGVSLNLLCDAIAKSAQARVKVLDFCEDELSGHAHIAKNGDPAIAGGFALASHIPKVASLFLHPDQLARVIGPGGARVQVLREVLGVDIVADTHASAAHVYGENSGIIEDSVQQIQKVFWTPDEGTVFDDCEVTSYMPSAAVVRFTASRLEGTVPVTEMDFKRVDSVQDAMPLGKKYRLKVIKVTEEGRIKLSKRAVMMDEFMSMYQAIGTEKFPENREHKQNDDDHDDDHDGFAQEGPTVDHLMQMLRERQAALAPNAEQQDIRNQSGGGRGGEKSPPKTTGQKKSAKTSKSRMVRKDGPGSPGKVIDDTI